MPITALTVPLINRNQVGSENNSFLVSWFSLTQYYFKIVNQNSSVIWTIIISMFIHIQLHLLSWIDPLHMRQIGTNTAHNSSPNSAQCYLYIRPSELRTFVYDGFIDRLECTMSDFLMHCFFIFNQGNPICDWFNKLYK